MIRKIEINIPTLEELKVLYFQLFLYLIKKSYFIELYAFQRYGLRFWKLMFKLTGRCGSRLEGHTPIFGNRHKWLWTYRRGRNTDINTCSVCGEVYRESGKLGTRITSFAKKGREADWASLEKGYKTATNEAERTAIKRSMAKLKHEDKRIGAMREDLIKATRNQDHERIKEIHEYIATKAHYKNER